MSTVAKQPVSASKSAAYVALGVALISVCSWISIPTVVPFTLQTFAIFAVLGLLGGRLGTLSILCYLGVGLVGLPVFAGFSAGPGALLGATGGYLLGFLGAGLLYWLITSRLGDGQLVMAVSLALGLLLVYTFGSLWFMTVYANTTGAVGLLSVLSWCVFPFLLPDTLKLALALLVTRRVRSQLSL